MNSNPFSKYQEHFLSHETRLRFMCATDALIQDGGAQQAECIFTTSSGIVTVDMDEIDVSVEVKEPEQVLLGKLPSRLDAVLNRKIDQEIIRALDHCEAAKEVVDFETAEDSIGRAFVALGTSSVAIDDADSMFGLATPGFRAKLTPFAEKHGEYVDLKFGRCTHRFLRCGGINWLFHPALSGAGTEAEKCYIFHRCAMGHALDVASLAKEGGVTGGIDVNSGAAWMRARTRQKAVVLEGCGVARVMHNAVR